MTYSNQASCFGEHRNKQDGAALIIFFLVLILVAMTFLFSGMDGVSMKIEQENKAGTSLAEAKAALIGYAVKNPNVTLSGYFPNPDIGTSTEGAAVGSFSGNIADVSLIGKLPWVTLGVSVPKDSAGECLWYVVSGRFKNNPKTSVLNWDTQGQIDVIDGVGNLIATNLAALVVSPGQLLSGQNHNLADTAFIQCGGNYDARNYLDSYSSLNAISGEVNYFVGATNNRIASNTNNKRFVFAKNDYYNDRFLFVTVDEMYKLITRRVDFSAQITALLNDSIFKAHLQSITILGSKGTNNIDCTATSNADNQTFCKNWKEMLLLTQLTVPSPIKIDGIPTAACSRVLIFGGQKVAAQIRSTAANKTAPINYLEGTNLSAFAIPTAINTNFDGVSSFNPSNPSADILRCL